MKKIFALFALMLLCIGQMFAYDFEVDGIYYNKSGSNATVTYKTSSYNSYSGIVIIPATVTYDGVTYSVTSVGIYAFYKCSGLTSITIPSSVTSIGSSACGGCTGLTSITVAAGNTKYDSRDNCNGIIETATNTLIQGCNNTTIPSSVTSIGDYSFYSFSGLTYITIPNSVTSIGEGAFQSCSGLTSVTIPSSVTSIGDDAFKSCTSLPVINNIRYADCCAVEATDKSLASYSFKEGTKFIGSRAFENCSGLTSITIPNSVVGIGNYAFSSCSSLTSINVVSGNIKYDSRDNCNAIIETATNKLIAGCKNTSIPGGVTSIGTNAFYKCSGLTSITIPSSVKSISGHAFDYCSDLTSVTIPNSVTSIGMSAFLGCSGLTSVTIPNSVTSIGMRAFQGCSGLTSITIPNSVTTLPAGCFQNCTGLKSITFPESIQDFRQEVLSYCKNVSIVRVRSRSMPTTHPTNFDSMSGATLYVPANLVEQYKATSPWKKFGTILPFYEGELVDGTSYNSSTNSEILDLSYTRTFTSTNWQALYVPFSMNYDDWKDYMDVYDIYNVLAYDEDNNGEIERTTVNMIRLKEGAVTEPNYPYVVRAKNAGDVEITLTDGTLYAAEENSIDCTSTKQKFTFTGTYEPMTGLATKGYYALSGGELKTAIDDAVTLKPQRWYMEVTNRNGSPAAATRVYLNPFGEENEVEGVKGVAVNVIGEETTYDLNGRAVNAAQLPKGLYVRGGKKIIVK